MKKRIICLMLICILVLSSLTACGKEKKKDDNVLRVGMECAYAPFNWTQDSDKLANGEKAVPIYGTNLYAYHPVSFTKEQIAKLYEKAM